ncbi:hypothetical protein [Sphaerobacter sp.]|uniref:hypothetical protein n=1 Tax=Sphaerobacter sp. TaxID=2099654 RepID=UPI001D4ECEA7|nr:hypothetical protein [Sphaerobacter sp.]MBX5446519.1 hypothetical protein [Sphaerobacter sp.]
MDPRLIALELFLTELDIPVKINSLGDRKRVQKAVYLGQLTGVDLGYRFGWYLMGPYSPALTRDYYALAESLESDESELAGKRLHPSVSQRLRRIRQLLDVPSEIPLLQEDWLELLASYHFLRHVRGLSHDDAALQLNLHKPHLAKYTDAAADSLYEFRLLSGR